jgi:integrase
MKLTKRVIDAAVYQGNGQSRHVLWDSEIPGLGVRLYPAGAKGFVLSYRVHGRKRLMVLGAYGVLTLDQARREARKLLVAVEAGGDPLNDRWKESKGQTVRELCLAYLERHAKPHKKTWKDDERRVRKYLLPAWGNLKARAIGRADAAALHSRIGETHRYEANRVLELVSKMFELAWRWGFVPEGHANPARGIDSFKEEKRYRWVTPEELPRLALAIDQETNPYARAALWLYLLTGLRKSEVLTARWECVDFVRKELRLPHTKAGRAHYLPLSEPALAALSTIPRVEGNPYIIVGLREGAHLVNISKPWLRVRKAAGVEDVRLHDLRRTVGSWLAQAGNSLHLIGRVLNHSSQTTTAVYARFAQDHVREALEAHALRLLGVAGKQPVAEIVAIKEAQR